MRKGMLKITLMALTLLLVAQSASVARVAPRHVRFRQMILVATTTTTLADIANQIGGRRVMTTPMLKANQDFRNPKIYRSMKHAAQEAEVFVRLGADYDPWMSELLKDSGNKTITPCSSLDVDASKGLLNASAPSQYWLDPANGKNIAANILAGLSEFSPKDASYFRGNYDKFCRKLDMEMMKWQAKLADYKGTRVVTCCSGCGTFYSRFGLTSVGTITGQAGVQTATEPVFVDSTCTASRAQIQTTEPGVRVVELPSAVKSKKAIRNYFDMFDEMTVTLQKALS